MKEVLSLLTSVLIITAAGIFLLWQRLQIVRLENQTSQSLKTIRHLEDTNGKLKFQRAALRSLAHVTKQAEKELGMMVLEKDQLIVLNESWEKQP